MAIRRILTDEDPTLKKKSRPVLNFDRRLHTLLDDMAETLEDANGLGLAAPQVGVLRRVVVVVDENDEILELVNPVIVEDEGSVEDAEGCLSFPGLYGIVDRPAKVTIEAQNRYGKKFTATGEGLVARAFCHETDHLDGTLFVDKVIRYITEDEKQALREGLEIDFQSTAHTEDGDK